MLYSIPGPRSVSTLEKGCHLARGGGGYDEPVSDASGQGFMEHPPQFINDRAEGPWIYDPDGNRYVDFHAGWASNPLGNAHPEIIEAVVNAFKRWGFSYEHPLQYELAERLVEISPAKKLRRVNFEISGTEAAEAAVSTALFRKERPLVIVFEDAFHGDSIAARALSSLNSDRAKYLEAWRGGAIHVPYPHTYHVPAGMNPEQYADYIIWYIEDFICSKVTPPESIAGILFEPCMAEGGNWIPPATFITGLKRLAGQFDWLLLADEVLVGLGRTGRMWAVEHWDLVPDVLVTGKNLSGGIEPIAAILGTEEVMAENEAHSGSTFAGSPAGCAAALKTLELFERDGVVEYVRRMGEKALQRMQKWPCMFEIVGQVRVIGLLLGASIVDKETGKADREMALSVYYEALRHGAWLINDNEANIRLYPALNIEEDTLEYGLTAVEEALAVLGRERKVYRCSAYPTFD